MLDTVAQHAWFRLDGANLDLLWEVDDAATDDDDNDTGINVVKDAYAIYRIDIHELTGIKFFHDNVLVATSNTVALTASHKLQPFIQMTKDSGTTTDSLLIDYVTVSWDRA